MKKAIFTILLMTIIPIAYAKDKILTLIKYFPKDNSVISNDYLVHPHDLDIMKGKIVICDLEESCIKIFSSSGDYLNGIYKKGQGPGEIITAFKATVDDEKSLIYLLDTSNSRISVYNANGEYIKTIKTLNPPKNIYYYKNNIYTYGYNDAKGTLFNVYDQNGKIINNYEVMFDESIVNNSFTPIMYDDINITSDEKYIYAIFSYIPYVCIYSKEGTIIKRIKINSDKVNERYINNVKAIKTGIENGFLKIFGWNNGGVLYDNKIYFLSNIWKGYDERILVFDLQGELIEEILFDDYKIDKSNYKFAAIVNGEYIFYDWDEGKVKIYKEK